MKTLSLATILLFLFLGCNKNPNKEARIQALESELVQTKEKITELETRIKVLENETEGLKAKVLKTQNE